jgi:hypothetical protein
MNSRQIGSNIHAGSPHIVSFGSRTWTEWVSLLLCRR